VFGDDSFVAVNPKPLAVSVVVALTALQTLALRVVSGVFVYDTVTRPARIPPAGAIFLDVMRYVSVRLPRCLLQPSCSRAVVRSTRSAIIVWQMTAIGIGIASARGIGPRWEISALLISAGRRSLPFFACFSRRCASRHLDPELINPVPVAGH